MTADLVGRLIDGVAGAIRASAEELTKLDQAIGDGDHGINLSRGFGAIAEQREQLAPLPLGQALQKAGMTLVMKVGGASGPLYGSLLMGIGKALGDGAPASLAELTAAVQDGVEAVKRRGKSEAGEKTMLDVLVPVLAALQDGTEGPPDAAIAGARAAADRGLADTKPMRATKGRASYLGERSIGHLDPGARSSALLVHAIADVVEGRS